MARALWSGSISFGLVNIPVRVVGAVAPKDLHFHLLHDKDKARLRQKRICSLDGEEVDARHTLRAYETAPGSYVPLTDAELREAAPEATRTIDIQDFVSLKEVDPLYFEHPYYVAPGPSADKAYALFRRACEESGRVAVGRIVFHTKQHLALIRARDKALVLTTLYYADEVIPQESLPLPAGAITDRELALAKQLIDDLTVPFEPERYKDDYRETLLGLIRTKSEQGTVAAAAPAREPGARVVNLMEALEASLVQRGRGAKGAAAGPRAR